MGDSCGHGFRTMCGAISAETAKEKAPKTSR